MHGTHHLKLCVGTWGAGESPDHVRVAEKDNGEDGAMPEQKSLGVGGRQLSYLPQALLSGGDLKAKQGRHSPKGATAGPPAASAVRVCLDFARTEEIHFLLLLSSQGRWVLDASPSPQGAPQGTGKGHALCPEKDHFFSS